MNIEDVEKAIRIRWEDIERDWRNQFTTMDFPLLENEKIRIGLDENKRPCVVVEMPTNASYSDSIQVSRGLFICIKSLRMKNQEKARFIVSAERGSELVYSAFLSDYLMTVDLKDPRGSFEETLNEWKNKWAGLRKPIGPREEEGLVGEIATLLELSKHIDDSAKLVDSWKGPLDGIHDFETNPLHLEIKTTIRDPPVVRVSKLEQLAPRESGALYLIVVHSEIVEGANTLPMYIDRMLNNEKLISEKEAILERMERIGYSPKHRLHYTRGFQISKFTCCPINENTPIFPPELVAEVPSTVTDIRYSLHIKGLDRYTMTSDAWEKAGKMMMERDFTTGE